ncbi:hypothetical protein BDY19DRAFT_636107 [Irpex rosettiformis]|uniref:Uncharacterized protein n=1 Tax=Irpex rosettiformis TaxID=378272 RepID=A0ACB8UBP2_9APHY|nr:hypothetical protein BDY19DRAFT_636107 [Irpex rosettiformis]
MRVLWGLLLDSLVLPFFSSVGRRFLRWSTTKFTALINVLVPAYLVYSTSTFADFLS